MTSSETWYIVKQPSGHCDIVPALPPQPEQPAETTAPQTHWGPFPSQTEALARRVGLIRAGKCQPR